MKDCKAYVLLPDIGLVAHASIYHIADAVVIDFGDSIHEVGEQASMASHSPTKAIRNGHGEYWNKDQSILVAPSGRLAPWVG